MVFDRLTGYILPYAVAFILSIILRGVYLYSSHDVGDKRKFSFILIGLSLVVTTISNAPGEELLLSGVFDNTGVTISKNSKFMNAASLLALAY